MGVDVLVTQGHQHPNQFIPRMLSVNIQVSYQGFSNMASIWLATVLSGKQKSGLKTLVDQNVLYTFIYSEEDQKSFINPQQITDKVSQTEFYKV